MRVGPVQGAHPSAKVAPRSGAPAGAWTDREPGAALRAHTHEDEGEDDDDDAADLGEQDPVLDEDAADRGDEDGREDEDDGEAEDEQRRAEHHPVPSTLLEADVRQSGDVAEVAGHERQYARGEEGDQPGEHREPQRERQRSARDGLGDVGQRQWTGGGDRGDVNHRRSGPRPRARPRRVR
jgi:hypothetical protein